MNYYYVSLLNKDHRCNASKAMIDCDKTMHDLNFISLLEPAIINQSKDFDNIPYKIHYLKQMKAAIKKLDSEKSIIFIQYPTYLGNLFLFKHFFARITSKYKIVYIIHDLNGIRFNSRYINKVDSYCFAKAYKLISHNELMSKLLTKKFNILPNRILNLELFDYYIEKINNNKRNKNNGIDFAGNISKSLDFLGNYYLSNIKTRLNLYGYLDSKDKIIEGKNMTYKGIYPPDHIQEHLEGSFGLVWDGTSINYLEGMYGEYQKINNPYKASLYIVSGLPLICSIDSAIAKIVTKYNIGICVRSLSEIDEKIEKLTDKQYENMKNNVEKLAIKLIDGGMLKKAISSIL